MKYFIQILPALVILSFCDLLRAQVAPSIEWEKSFGGSRYDFSRSVQQTNDGGYIVAGSSGSIDGDIIGHHGPVDFPDYWIMKLDISGSIVWQKSLGGSGDDEAFSIQQTADSGYIIAGESSSNDGDVSVNHGGADYWVVKLDAEGNMDWQKSFGGSEDEVAWSVQQTIDGGFIVAGNSYSNDGDVSGNHGSSGYYYYGGDYWIIKLDSVGNLIWQHALGGSSDDFAYSIKQTIDGGLIVAGGSFSNDGDVSGNHGGSDYWIVKLDTSGNIMWQKCLGQSSYDYAYSIQQTSDRGFITVGWGGFDNGACWAVKLDSIGNTIWDNGLGGSGGDIGQSVQQTTDGGFIVAGGTSTPNDGDVSGYHFGYYQGDYWIVKLNVAGHLLWQECLGGSSYDQATSIDQTNDNGFIISGWSWSNDDDITDHHGSTQVPDFWIVRLTPDTINGIAQLSTNTISLFPNPVQSQLTINLATPANEASIRLYDVQGRMIALPTTLANTQAQLNTTTLPDGFYTLQITNNKTGENEVGKFVKQ